MLVNGERSSFILTINKGELLCYLPDDRKFYNLMVEYIYDIRIDILEFAGETFMIKLIKLTEEYKTQLGEMIDEWKHDQEVNHTNHSPWAIFKNDYHDFDYYLANLEVDSPCDGLVPDSTFFLLDDERNILLGAVNIRHYLNDYLLQHGGHIGDGIRPSERKKGYATKMIRLALEECRKLGIEKVLIVCDKDNIGSAKSIINNGGVLENEITDEDGTIEQRYWIDFKFTTSNF